MPPKSSSGKDKDLTSDEEVLQAVILADSFNRRFRPLTVGKPRCLLPICNATLLDWTFESLSLAGVQEIFVICRSYANLVKAAIRDSKWSKPSSGLKIVCIVTAKETFSPGDAMRDIYTHGIITSDFVLVTGDLVSNIRIDEVVRVHKERRRTNKDAIMTMVVKESGAVHRTRSKGDSAVFVLDAETSECLHYEPVTGYPPKRYANIPREILAEHPEVEIRNDFIDCSIDVCSVEVPSLFQDNFDYADIRRDFVHGVLTSDLLMKNIYCYIAKEGYAARVADTRSYDAISKDILSRWTFPLVPDDNHPGGHAYDHLRGNKYIAKGNSVVLSRTCKIGPNTLVGAHTTISEYASVHASVVGEHCTIGPRAVLRNAYVFDGTTIGEGSELQECIVGAGVNVGAGSVLAPGSVVGDGVVLGAGARLQRFERVSRRRVQKGEDADTEEEDEELEEAESKQPPVEIVGEGSNAVVWPQGAPEDDEDLDEVERFNNRRLMRIGDTASDLELSDPGSESEPESDSDSDSSSLSGMHALSRTSSATSASTLAPVSSVLHSSAADREFLSEVAQSLERAFAEGHSVDNAAVELKTLRMASNVPLRKVRAAVVGAIVERIVLVAADAAAQRKEIGKVIDRWGALIDRIGGVDKVETVEVLQHHCAQSARLPLFGQLLASLYQADIVDEDDIRAWHVRVGSDGEGLKAGAFAEGMRKCWAVGGRMIQQFDEQESSEEEEDDDDDEEDDDNNEDEKPSVTAKGPAPGGKDDSTSEEESGSGSGSEDESGSEAGVPPPTVKPPVAQGSTARTPVAGKSEPKAESVPAKPAPDVASEESEEESGESEEETAPSASVLAAATTARVAPGPAKAASTPAAIGSKTTAATAPSVPVLAESSESEEESEEAETSSEENSEEELGSTSRP